MNKPPTIIAIAHHKGGVGKSTLAWAVSSNFFTHFRTQVLNLDPQVTASSALSDQSTPTIYAVLVRGTPIRDAIVGATSAYGKFLKMIPASPLLAGLNAETSGRFDRHHILVVDDDDDDDALAKIEDFNSVIIDCPSARG